METSLHRQLKATYADENAQIEAPIGKFRIDVIRDSQLVEIQHGPLAAIRDKIRVLVQQHQVLVVKPIVVHKTIVRQDAKAGRIVGRRRSPKRGKILDLFEELVYFTRVFPHENLTLEVPMVEIEEWRYPGHGRRRRWRKNDHQVEDQKLLKIGVIHRFRHAADLARLLPAGLPASFHTGHMAQVLDEPRCVAQRIAYCFRHMGVTREVGEQGNARLYQFADTNRAAA